MYPPTAMPTHTDVEAQGLVDEKNPNGTLWLAKEIYISDST